MNEGIVANLRRAADKWEKNHPIIGVGELRVHDALRDAARCIEDTSAKVPKWISVEEQPNPPEDGSYWCYGYWIRSGRKQMEEAEYLGGEWKIANNFVLTHYMPLPSIP